MTTITIAEATRPEARKGGGATRSPSTPARDAEREVRETHEDAVEARATVQAQVTDGGRFPLRRTLLLAAAALMIAAIFFPLWGMTLVSVQYPEGLRMVVYLDRIVGDISELNVLHHYVGMAQIDRAFFGELDVIRGLFVAIGAACALGAVVRKAWSMVLPLVLMGGAAVYGFWSMHTRLYDYGHDLDPRAAMDMQPFTPPMFGQHTIAQFGTYAWFGWGTFLPVLAGVLVTLALWITLTKPDTHS